MGRGIKIASIVVATAVWLYSCFQFVQYLPRGCEIGDWSRTTSAIVLAAAASSGWMIVSGIVLFGSLPFGSRQSLRKLAILSDAVGSRLTSACAIRIFCSQSESYRGFVHDRVKSLKPGSTIKVLMRNDNSATRLDDLRKVAERWKNDISGRGVNVDVRAVSWSPIMFRGWLFDEDSAVIGWYNRTPIRTLGQGDDTFLIEDKDMVKGLASTFDAVFETGTQL